MHQQIFNEVAGRKRGADPVAVRPIGAYESSDSNDPRIRKQLGHGPDAADILFPVLGRKTESESLGKFGPMLLLEHRRPGVQAVTDIIAVEDEAMHPQGVELVIYKVGDSALAAGLAR